MLPWITLILGLLAIGVLVLMAPERQRRHSPLVTLVYLLQAPRLVSAPQLAEYAKRAFGRKITCNDPDATDFVMSIPSPPVEGIRPGQGRTFMLQVDGSVFMINNFSIPYLNDPEAHAKTIADRRLAKAVASHRGWLSIDAIGNVKTQASRDKAYRLIGRLMAELAGPDCLGILCPELDRCNVYDDSLVDALRSEQPLALFQAPTLAPVIGVEGSDPRMVAAVAEARRCWPEFAAAFAVCQDANPPFAIKAEFREGDKSEFMWVSVKRIDGETVYGILDNTPDELKTFKAGQEVVISLEHLNDWIYAQDQQPVGGFTVKAIQEIQKGK
jgi:uncharacterized protein YegJ (DUF2314 family)